MRPVPSRRSTKVARPMSRMATIRPATSSGGRSSAFSPALSSSEWASAMLWLRAARAGKGSRPAARSRSSLVRRSSMSSSSLMPSNCRRGAVTRPAVIVTFRERYLLVNVLDGPVHHPGRRLDRDLLADPLAHERLAHRRLISDAAGLGISLRAADQRVLLLLLLVVDDGHLDAQLHHLAVVRFLDDDSVLDERLQLQDFTLNQRLFVLGVLVLGRVLAAGQLPGLLYAMRHFRAAHVHQVVQLLLELGQALTS